MRKLPDIENLIVELVSPHDEGESRKRMELIALIEDYFGEHDTRLILAIALYFKRPSQLSWLRKVIEKELQP